ncbi:hypothetical protein D3C77_545250 [compost metagenome]
MNRCNHPHYIGGFGDIVNTQDARTLGHRQRSQGKAAIEPFSDRTTKGQADHALARNAHQQGTPQLIKRFHVLEQAKVVLQRLGKAETRIKNDPLGLDTDGRASCHSLFKIARYLGSDILVMRIVLHVARLAAHMHQAHWQTGSCSSIQGTVTTERTHIVDQPGTEPG